VGVERRRVAAPMLADGTMCHFVGSSVSETGGRRVACKQSESVSVTKGRMDEH
jgi:hypothetical protein